MDSCRQAFPFTLCSHEHSASLCFALPSLTKSTALSLCPSCFRWMSCAYHPDFRFGDDPSPSAPSLALPSCSPWSFLPQTDDVAALWRRTNTGSYPDSFPSRATGFITGQVELSGCLAR